MEFEEPLIEGVLLKRYKRFLADVKLTDHKEPVLVHVANSGSMLGVKDPGSRCRISTSKNVNRKIPYTLEMVLAKEGSWVGVNTSLPNKLVEEAFHQKLTTCWQRFESLQREVKIHESSRLDLLLSKGEQKCFVEIKNVSMARPPIAVFPDAVTERGQKHLKDLMDLTQRGHQSEIFFVVQREDCEVFRPCDDIDPEYGKLLRKASKAGVVVRCWSCKLTERSITLAREIVVDLS